MIKYVKENLKTLILLAMTILVGFFLVQWVQTTVQLKDATIRELTSSVVMQAGLIEKQETELDKLRQSQAITSTAAQDIKNEIENSQKSNTAAMAEMKRQMTAIEEKYKPLPKTAVNEERMNAEISVVRSKGLWATYCIQEPTNQYCKDN